MYTLTLRPSLVDRSILASQPIEGVQNPVQAEQGLVREADLAFGAVVPSVLHRLESRDVLAVLDVDFERAQCNDDLRILIVQLAMFVVDAPAEQVDQCLDEFHAFGVGEALPRDLNLTVGAEERQQGEGAESVS